VLEIKDNDKRLSVWAGVATAAFVISVGVMMIKIMKLAIRFLPEFQVIKVLNIV
jgi:hypothetical protein